MADKILIIRSGAIGDVLMTTPLIRGIRKKFPKARISYLTGRWSKGVLEGNKRIDELIVFDDDIIARKNLAGFLNLVKRIKGKGFDLCIVLDKSYLWSLFAYFCGIPKRYGFSRNWGSLFNTKSVKFDGSKYELDYNLDVGKLLDINVKDKKMELFLGKGDLRFADDFVKRNKLKNIIGMGAGGARNPGQDMAVKRWPKKRYIELINKLTQKYDIILFGGPGDKEINDEIAKSVKRKHDVVNLTGKSLKQSAALINKCRYFVTHDSGLMHVASTTKTRLITIFGPTQAERFAPRNAVVIKNKTDCRPCYDIYGHFRKCKENRCMELVKTEDVLGKIRNV